MEDGGARVLGGEFFDLENRDFREELMVPEIDPRRRVNHISRLSRLSSWIQK